MPTYYEILGVEPDAGKEQIQAAHDALMKQCYARLRDPKTHDESVDRIKQIKLAYDHLIDAGQRIKYDAAEAEEKIKQSKPPNPWRRFFARHFDMLIFFALYYPVYRYLADYVFFEDWVLVLEGAGAGIVLYFLIETAVVSLLGFTPGKWMLSIRPMGPEGQKLKRGLLAKRNLMSALYGLALDIPPFSFVAMALQYRNVYKPESNGRTKWDSACGTVVRYEPIKRVRLWLILPVAVLAVIALVNIANML